MQQFNIGDIVQIIAHNETRREGNEIYIGCVGEVREYKERTNLYTISFGDTLTTLNWRQRQILHDCNGALALNVGRYFHEESLNLIKPIKKPRSPKPKRKGYALWIYNIEKKLKKGVK